MKAISDKQKDSQPTKENLPRLSWQTTKTASKLYPRAYHILAPLISRIYRKANIKKFNDQKSKLITFCPDWTLDRLLGEGIGNDYISSIDVIPSGQELIVRNRRLYNKCWMEYKGQIIMTLIKPLAIELKPFGISVFTHEPYGRIVYHKSVGHDKDGFRKCPGLEIVFKFKRQ